VVELTDTTQDPAIWGKNFPFQYDAYLRTTAMVPTRFGGSEAMPRVPTTTDPRTVVSRSRLDEDPRLKTMWAGYAFAVDFRERRGHAYMLEDQMFTGRQQATHQPGTCLHCHTSAYVPYLRAGNGNLTAGFERLNPLPYDSARKWFDHPVACIDCHDPRTMQLRITRPAFLEGIRALRRHRGSRTTMRTPWRPVRRCGASSAGSATSSTTSRDPTRGWCFRGGAGCRWTASWRSRTRRARWTGPTP